MKLQHYALIFIALSIGAILSMFLYTRQNHNAMVESEDSTFEITASLLDAMNDAIRESSDDGTYLFNSSEKRTNAYNSFFDTLSLNLQHYVSKDEYTKDAVPCIFFVDTNGFYVAYQKKVTDEYFMDITPINTWTEEINNGAVLIRYYLSDYVEITNRVPNGNEKFEYAGTVKDVYNSLSSRLKGILSGYLIDYDTYCDMRSEYIAKRMENETNYYVNTYNVHAQYNYELQIPHTTMLNYGKQIDRPCMYALIQGKYFGIAGTKANIFAYANSEVIDSYNCYMYKNATGETYYHSSQTCVEASGSYYGSGTMKECAKKGFSPCPVCAY